MSANYEWKGNLNAMFVTLGAHGKEKRQEEDFYATDPIAMELLLDEMSFHKNVWEPSVGKGHLAEVLKKHNYNVRTSDIVDRGYPNTEIINFLCTKEKNLDCDIISNPPYICATEYCKKALEVINDGFYVALFLKIQFLETVERWNLFKNYPPKYIYVSTKRIGCAKYGDFEKYSGSAICYCWYIWQKGYKSEPILRWINTGENKKIKYLF